METLIFNAILLDDNIPASYDLPGITSRSILQKPAQNLKNLASPTLMRLILCSAQRASMSLIYSGSVQECTDGLDVYRELWHIHRDHEPNDRKRERFSILATYKVFSNEIDFDMCFYQLEGHLQQKICL
jgi:hypothetical protein